MMDNEKSIDECLAINSDAFRTMFMDHDAIMYIVDLETFFIIDANRAALNFYGYDIETMRTKRIPDLNTEPEEDIRAEVNRAVEEGRSFYVFKHRLANGEIRDVEIYANPITFEGRDYLYSVVHDITELKKVENERELLIAELKSALEEIKTLRGIIPICSTCKKIRSDEGQWTKIETYVEQHSDALFSHGLCNDCMDKHYGKELWYKKDKEEDL